MSELDLSSELFAGALIFIALSGTGTSDEVTKPVSGSNLWKELASVSSFKPKAAKVTETLDVPTANGWEEQKREFTVADMYEATTNKTPALYHQLQFGLANAIVAGTAQTSYVTSDRKVKAWVKVQLRQHIGTDRYVHDFLSEIRLAGDPPAAEKSIQKPNLEFYVMKNTTLNAFNIPA